MTVLGAVLLLGASASGALAQGESSAGQVDVLEAATGQSRERLVHDLDRDYILRGEDAGAYGVVDEVLRAVAAQPLAHVCNARTSHEGGQRPSARDDRVPHAQPNEPFNC